MAKSAMGSSRPKLSPNEQSMLGLISSKPQTTEELTKRFYARRELPWHGRSIVSGLVRSLEKKTRVVNFGYVVHRSRAAGPHSIEVWKTKK